MSITGNYSKTIKGGYDERKRLILGFCRKGIPVVDADENTKEWARFTQMRRAFDVLIGNASPNQGFKAVGTSALNDFKLKGGNGTLDGAGRMYVSGIGCFLLSDIFFANLGATEDEASIHPEVALVSPNDTINDTQANYVPGELVGRTIYPDITDQVLVATVLANTENTIQTDIDLVAAGIVPGKRYRIALNPPSVGTRTDDVYLDASVVEVDGVKEPSIRHNFGAFITAQHFGRIRQTIYIRQGGGSVPLTYTDADGLDHWRTKIARIDRFAGQDAINVGDVTDLRETSASLTAFVPKAGGTMTGDLQLSGANIVMFGGETVDGRDVSVDGAKLDTIDWSPAGVAAKLALISWPVEATSLTAITGGSVNVSKYFKGKVPGATTAQKGVFTDLPYNKAPLLDSTTRDQFLDASDPPNQVYGRTTYATLILTGTLSWTNASSTVTGVGTLFTSQLSPGDIVKGPDNQWYTVGTITNDTQFVMAVGESFAGSTTAGTTNRPRERWTLTFYSNVAGTETAYSFGTSTGVAWAYHEMFDEATRPTINPLFGIPSDAVVAEVPDATTTTKGKVLLAADTESSALKVPKANDTRLGRVKAELGGAGTTGLEPILNFIQGSGVTISVTESGGKIHVTIANSSPGGGSSPPSGSAGGDLSGSYPNPQVAQVGGVSAATIAGLVSKDGITVGVNSNGGADPSVSVPAGTARCAVIAGNFGIGFPFFGVATASSQASIAITGSATPQPRFAHNPADVGNYWTSSFSGPNVTTSQTGGPTSPGWVALAIGDRT